MLKTLYSDKARPPKSKDNVWGASKIILWFFCKCFSINFKPFLSISFFASDDFLYYLEDTFYFVEPSSLGHLFEWIQSIISIYENPFGIGLTKSGNALSVIDDAKVGGENQFLIFGMLKELTSLTSVISLTSLARLGPGMFLYRIQTMGGWGEGGGVVGFALVMVFRWFWNLFRSWVPPGPPRDRFQAMCGRGNDFGWAVPSWVCFSGLSWVSFGRCLERIMIIMENWRCRVQQHQTQDASGGTGWRPSELTEGVVACLSVRAAVFAVVIVVICYWLCLLLLL